MKYVLSTDRKKLYELLALAPNGYVVEIHKPTRSLEQNALYWATVHDVADNVEINGQKFTPQVWHIYFKQRFLPGRIIELPNGQIIEKDPSTTELTVEQFSDFVTQVIQWNDEQKTNTF